MGEEKLDFKKRDKDLYMPGMRPSVIQVPAMNFIMADGKGNPNDEGGEYQQAVELLYALSYSIKMDLKKNGETGCPDYVVPPLEGLWWLEEGSSADSDFTQKEKYHWTSMIRQAEFVTRESFEKARRETAKKKPGLDVSRARFESFEEGLCVQVMHLGPYDEEPKTIAKIEAFLNANGYRNAIGDTGSGGAVRRHHEIYLGDPRKTEPSRMKTVLRHPIK